jgi:hypothetical protein
MKRLQGEIEFTITDLSPERVLELDPIRGTTGRWI